MPIRDTNIPLWLVRLGAGSLLGLALVSSPALAAPPPSVGGGGAGPEEQACSGRSVGDACTLPNQQLGTCGEGTCNRLDYSQGSPPKAIEEACVVCRSAGGGHSPPPLGSGGAPPDGADADAGGADAGDDGGADDKEPPQSSSRCALGDRPGLPGLLGLALLVLLRRRREEP